MIIPIITGPTSSGKSGTAYNAALKTGMVEIISADAFQVYTGLDIGTAKVSKQEMQQVKHHLINIMQPDKCYSAGMFMQQAEELIDDILKRGKVPIIAGGTGLYIKSLTDGIFDCPEIESRVREELQKKAEKDGLSVLYHNLIQVDKEYASKISSNDPARIIRALEIYYGLGISLTEAHKKYSREPKYKYTCAVLWQDRKALYERINERTVQMWQKGWKQEVENLLNAGYTVECPSFRAIGYKLIADYIINGGSEEYVINQIAKETRHFAKRQFTWFKNKENIVLYDNVSLLENSLIDLINGKRSLL
ncbi:MAG: tRNA (adenosine(37)-N6)-dimethylallyltransferase MiaA [Mucispirillum sp.]|nr:tRNA (adenosine(37)-N6)-dimethylallyltransferase MiaA [Mucispirillum sp.]